MKSRKYLCIGISICFLAAASAQQRPQTSERPTRSTSVSESVSRRLTSPTGSRSQSLGTHSSGSSSSASGSFGSPSFGAGGNGQGGPIISIPVQTYAPDTKLDYGQWYRCNSYVSRLLKEYSYLPGEFYLWRYAQGDSPLTHDSVKLALEESTSDSRELARLADQLLLLLRQYESGAIGQEEFSESTESVTKEIRDLAKDIRKDDLLDYLDQRRSLSVPDYRKADSLEGLQDLIVHMKGLVSEVESGIELFARKDATRIVDVEELQKPSFETITKGIDKLAKTIEDSAKKL